MKHRTTLTLFMVLLVTFTFRANGADEVFPLAKVNAFELKIVQIADSLGITPPPKSQRIRDYVMTNDIPHDVYIATMEKVAEELMSKTVVYTNNFGKESLELRSGSQLFTLVNIMGNLGDREYLPWLEKQANESQWISVRERSSIAYVKIAGLDATPFVQKILTGGEEKYDFYCKAGVAKEFFDQIAQAAVAKATQGKIDAAYAMLIEQVLNEQNESIAWELDKRLAQHLPEYRASHQRNVVLSHFLQSPNEIARANFRKKQEELQMTPKAERTDLSKRFPDLAEVKLEDEQQTEAPSPAEDK